MKVSDEKIDELFVLLDVLSLPDDYENVRDWLASIEQEQNQRIAESLLNTDDALPVFLKNQAE